MSPKSTTAALGAAAPPAMEKDEAKLLEILKSDAPRKEKMDACRDLGVVGSKKSIPVLSGLLADEELSHMARYALEPNPDAAVDAALREALGELTGRQLVGAIVSVGVRRDRKAVGQLKELLGNSDPDAVAAAARSLGRIATPDAAASLKKAMPSAGKNVCMAVADACLACAERLVASGKNAEAASLYAVVAKADLPEHVRKAAERGAADRRSKVL